MTDKKIVTYKPGSIIIANFGGQRVAILNPIEGRQPDVKEIITADIVNYDPASGTLETEQTIYVPKPKET